MCACLCVFLFLCVCVCVHCQISKFKIISSKSDLALMGMLETSFDGFSLFEYKNIGALSAPYLAPDPKEDILKFSYFTFHLTCHISCHMS